jgi:tRNA-specific 2-thiouridylase
MKNNKVLLGMSGGVDSSIAAYILTKKGYEVIGATIQMTDIKDLDAPKVCKELGIGHIYIDRREEFGKEIISYFLNEYKEGKTPNPCVLCNRKVKFQTLVEEANKLDCTYIATGHYVRVVKRGNRYLLKKGKDKTKDQSYVLYNLTQEQLSRCIFPLGNIAKNKVRDIAKKLNLEVANKKDSQEICFIPDNNYSEYIEENSKESFKKGNIVDKQGNILGEHNGIYNYTIGQRKGIKISSKDPLYVIDIDIKKNEIVVGDESDIYLNKLIATNLNWIGIEELNKEMKVKAKIRYGGKEEECRISNMDNNRVLVEFKKEQRAITSGQSVVFYKDSLVLGGGIIV